MENVPQKQSFMAKFNWPLFWIIFLGIILFIVVRLIIPFSGLVITWVLWIIILIAAVIIGAPHIKLDLESRTKQIRTLILASFMALGVVFAIILFLG